MKRAVRKLVLIVSMVLIAANSVAAKDWRGILPMHSTRADVEAVLGPPPPSPGNYALNKGRSIYFFDEGEVYITFAEDELPGRACLSTVPAGTVLSIRVTPKDELSLSRLNLDVSNFKKFDASKPPGPGHEGFISTQEGFFIRVFQGNVQEMIYFASAVDSERCPGYYQNIESAVQINLSRACSIGLDDYGDLQWSDEKARLDNFAIQVLNEKDSVGYIIVYAGQKATTGEAQLRANRARDYLITVRHINPERVKAIDGGYRVDLTVKLYIVPPGSEPPPVMPMLDPSQVQIVSEKKRRSRKRN